MLAGAALALVWLGPWLALNDLTALAIAARLQGPSRGAPLGCCILSRLLVGARWSLGLSLVISPIGRVLGALIGVLGAMAGRGGMLRWHHLPSVRPHLLGVWSSGRAGSILAIPGLGFLGFGMQPPLPEWGKMLLDAKPWIRSAPLLTFWPGLMILAWVPAINPAGDRLRGALADREVGLEAARCALRAPPGPTPDRCGRAWRCGSPWGCHGRLRQGGLGRRPPGPDRVLPLLRGDAAAGDLPVVAGRVSCGPAHSPALGACAAFVAGGGGDVHLLRRHRPAGRGQGGAAGRPRAAVPDAANGADPVRAADPHGDGGG